MRDGIINNQNLTHERSKEYGSRIIEAMETGRPFTFGGNVLNTGLIPNLPAKAVVEVPCAAAKTKLCRAIPANFRSSSRRSTEQTLTHSF